MSTCAWLRKQSNGSATTRSVGHHSRLPVAAPVPVPVPPSVAPQAAVPASRVGVMAMGLLGVVAVGGLAIRYSVAANEVGPTSASGVAAGGGSGGGALLQVAPAAAALPLAAPTHTEVTYSRQPLWLQRPRSNH